MANPITPVGRGSGRDIIEEAYLQDEEREIREADEYFRRTGENPRPSRLDNPLVDNNYSPDIANDGDSYDESIEPLNRHNVHGEYAEDNPTQFISETISRLQNNTRQIRQRPMEAYSNRQKEKEQQELNILKQKRIEQSKNAIMETRIVED